MRGSCARRARRLVLVVRRVWQLVLLRRWGFLSGSLFCSRCDLPRCTAAKCAQKCGHIYTPMDIVRNATRLAASLLRLAFIVCLFPSGDALSELEPSSSKEVENGWAYLFA